MSKTHRERYRDWLLKNPEKRNIFRKNNYDKTRHLGIRRPWTNEDDREICTSDLSDRELAEKLRRTVQAIQVRRSRVGGLR